MIELNQAIVGPRQPRLKNVRPRKLSDYPQVPRPWLDVAQRLSSTVRMGPPICDQLVAFVQHVFTEEEASVARHLGLFRGRTAASVARADHRDLAQTSVLLQRLAAEKHVVASGGPPHHRRYYLLPVVPGMLEMALIACPPEALSPWHRRFIELFETLYETGYLADYQLKSSGAAALIRVIPLGQTIDAHPMALPSDKLEIVLDRFDTFGIGQCQCRLTMQALGRGCGKPLGNCTIMGQWAQRGIEEGWLRRVSKRGALEIKREAESHGLVTWMMNVASSRGQCSCSCCGCCCHALRAVTEFNAPSMIAPPHFLPQRDAAACTYCGKCGQACPLNAILVDPKQKTYRHLLERCVGCGLCVVACDRKKALRMEAVPDYRLPYRSWFSFIAGTAPSMLRTSWKVWRERG